MARKISRPRGHGARPGPHLGTTYDQSGNVIPDPVANPPAVAAPAFEFGNLGDWLKPPKVYVLVVLAVATWYYWDDFQDD